MLLAVLSDLSARDGLYGSPKRSARTSRAPCTTRTMMTSVSVKR
jgi:hypothetical protein